jgi:micrococcal nuclease
MPRYRRSHQAQITGIAVLVVVALARSQGCGDAAVSDARRGSRGGLPPGTYGVERVIDGDTLLLRRHGRLRLQGIDCPEIAHDDERGDMLGPAATTFTQEFIRDAQHRIRVEVDGEPADHYGRWLAFVWNGNRLLNEELVRVGLARAMLLYDFGQSKKDRLRAAQLEAQRAARGIWSASEH